MRRAVSTAVCLLALLALGAAAAGATLTPAEQTWAAKVIKVYNIEAEALNIVQAQERVSGALVAASGAANTNLTKTLVVFASCPTWMKDYGKPPTARLMPFETDMDASCGHLFSGAKDVAHAIGELGQKHATQARAALAASLSELKDGSRLLAAAERQLAAVGSKSKSNNGLAA